MEKVFPVKRIIDSVIFLWYRFLIPQTRCVKYFCLLYTNNNYKFISLYIYISIYHFVFIVHLYYMQMRLWGSLNVVKKLLNYFTPYVYK